MAVSGKITTISCRIDLSDCNPLSYSLIFRPFYQMVLRFPAIVAYLIVLILTMHLANGGCSDILLLLQLLLALFYQNLGFRLSLGLGLGLGLDLGLGLGLGLGLVSECWIQSWS